MPQVRNLASAKPYLTVFCMSMHRLPMHASRSFSQLLGQGALQGSGVGGARGGGHARRHSRQTVSPRSATTVIRTPVKVRSYTWSHYSCILCCMLV